MRAGVSSPGKSMPGGIGSARALLPLICAAHFASHFMQFLVPSLLPLLRSRYGLSFAELGFLVTAFYIASGTCQIPAGVVVDRFGAGATLVSGLALMSCAFAAMSLSSSFVAMLIWMVVAGVGNSVFHPAGYTLMSAEIRPGFVGRAFSFHSIAGMAGYAVVPAVVGSLTKAMPLWSVILIPATAGLMLALVLAASFGASAAGRRKGPRVAGEAAPSTLSLISPGVLAGFGFFAFSAVPWIGAAAFLPTALNGVFGTPVEIGLNAVAAQLFASVPGTLIGGWLADASHYRLLVIGIGFAAAGGSFLSVGMWPLSSTSLILALGFAGLVEGMTTPSRDKMLKEAAPLAATGRAFAVAYAGYDLGSAATPACLGMLFDLGRTAWVVPAIAASYGAMILFSLQRRPARSSIAV